MFKGLKKIKQKLKMPKITGKSMKIPKLKSKIHEPIKIDGIHKMDYGIKATRIKPVGKKLSHLGRELKY